MTNSCCIASQTFIISYLTYQSKTFKTFIKKNDKSSRFKNFRRFRRFALHYESTESVESWENSVILADKRLDYFLKEFKPISNLILVALPLRHSLLVIWSIKAVPLRFKKKKNEKSSTLKNFRRFRGFALHYESVESAESWENFVLLPDERLDYLLTELKLVPNVQNSRKLIQTSFLLGR